MNQVYTPPRAFGEGNGVEAKDGYMPAMTKFLMPKSMGWIKWISNSSGEHE